MATEEEAREAADGEEVQVEAADVGTAHSQMNLDRKLSSHEEITDEAKIMDSTEGLLKVTEDQVSEKAPSAVEIPPEHTPNGTASSLNGDIKDEKISNGKPQENGQKDNEQVEASPDGISTDQSNRSNGEAAVDSLGHVESTTEDTSLLEHENEEPKEHNQQDAGGAAVEDKLVHEDTPQTDEPAVDAQQCQNLEPVEVTEDTRQHASTSCIPHDEVAAEAPAGVQTSLEPNVDDSRALPDATDGNTETKPAKVDKESCPENEDIAEHPNEIVKLDDQPSKQTDDVDADLVQEEVPKSKKSDVPEDKTKIEQADESTNGDQEKLDQESPEDINGPVHEKAEETSHKSNVSASEETTPEHDATSREPALDVQEEQNQGLAEEIADAKEVDTEETVQQSGVAFEEASPEDNVATIEPSSDIQHVNNVESEETKGLEDAKAEETSKQSNLTISEDAAQDEEATEDIQLVQGLEEEEPESTGTVETVEASNQPHAIVLNNLAEEDGVPACQPQVIELKEDVKDTGVTETQEITQQSHVAASEELVTEDNSMAVESQNDDIQQSQEQGSVEVKDTEAPETLEICHERTISASEGDSVEDDVAAEEPTCDAQEDENVESVEEIKDNTPDNIVETYNVATVEESDQENSVPTSQDVSEQQTWGLEPEDIQNTEPVETEEASDQSNPALLNDPPQEDSIPSDMPKTESTAEVAETEATCEEPASEENITVSEITCDAQEVESSEQAEEVQGNKDTETEEISDKSNEMATEDNTTILTDASIQQLQEQEQVEFRDSEATEPQGIPPSHIASTSEESTPEDNATAEPSPDTQAENSESATVTEETKDVESTDAIAEDETPQEHIQEFEAPVNTPPVEEPELEETKNTDNQMDAAVLEDPTHEDNPTASESLVMESAAVSSREATEGQEMPQSEDTQPEDHKTVENTTASEPEIVEPEPAEEIRDSEATEPRSISQQSIVSSSEEPEEDVTAKEQASDMKVVQTEEPELIEENNDVEVGEISNQSRGTTVGETAQDNLESATVTEDTKDVESSDAIAEEEPPEDVQEFEAPVDIPAVEEPKLKETKNTEPVEVHDNVTTNDQPAEEVDDTEATGIAEIHSESGDLTEDVKSNVALAEEAAPNEDAKATEATADIPEAQEPELAEIKNTEPVEVNDNVTTDDQPAEEVKESEATEIAEIHNESGDLTEDVKSNVALADVAAPDEDAKATEAAADMPEAQEPELEEIKNSEPVEVEDNIIARELPEEEIKDTQAMETEMIPDESTSANISELTNYVKSNVALAEEEAPKEHVIAAEATTDIPRAQEPELEEIKDTEPVEVEENISARDQSAEEIKDTEAMETEAINESTDTKNSELTENVNRNFTPEDEAAHEDHVLADETTVHIPRAQEPELEEIKNTETIEVKEDISASDLPAEEMKETEATETEVISESTDADISEPTEDAKRNVALADEAAPEEHVVATQAPVDIPRAQETELEEINNAEHVEVEENTSANNLPAEEVKDTETMETEATTDTTDTSITDLTEDAALADKAASDIHVDIPAAQEPTVEEVNNAEPVEAEDSITADDVLAEEINDTEAMGTEETPDESTDDSWTASAPLADIQQAPEQEAVENKMCNDTTENQGEPTPTESTVSTAAEITPTDEETTETEPTQETNVQNATAQETEGSEDVKIQEFSERSIFSTAEVPAQESPLLGGELASDVQQVLERDSAKETRGSEAVQTEDDQQHGVSNVEKPVSENNVPESEAHVADQVQEEKSAEVKDTEAMGTEEISIQVPTTENAAQESSEPGSDPDLLLQSEDSKDQFVEAEETGESNDASLEEPTAEDNAANETNPLADTKEEQGLESVEGNKGIDATEGEEASHPSQDAGLEELVSESIVATIEPASDIQQVNDLDEAKETTATEAKDDEETSCKKTEVANLEDPSLTDNGKSPKQKDESSDLGEKTAFTTQEGGSPNVQNSGEDTVGISNNIKEQSKDVTELGAIQIEEHANDQDNEQPHDVELPMQVCERSFDVSAIEHPDEDVQKVNLDQQQNEDEAIEKKTEEIQRDEQKHDDSSTDFTTETLLEPQSSEIGTPNLQEDNDVFEAEQTETVATEVLMNEQTQHIPQESIPNIADVEAEKSTETEEMSEHENTPNNTETLYTDAEDEKENMAKPSTDEQDGTVNEEDESSDLGEKTAFTTPEGGSPTEEDVVQISGEDTVGISNNIEQIKEQSKDVTELDAIQSEDHTNDQDNEQPHDVELPMQVGERSFDVSAIEHPDEDVQKVNLDQQQNEDGAIENKTEEIQRDEQKHDDSSTELTTETLLEHQSSEIGTPNLQEDTDVFEAAQTETVATEVLMNEQTQHIPQESIPNIADVEAEKSTETEEMSEHENTPNNTETLYTDAEDEKENIAKPYTDEQDGTVNEEDESSDLGEKTAFTTPEGGSPTEEDVVQISGEDTVGISNNIEQIKEQSKDIIELDTIQSEDHTNDQDNEQPHDVELPMQVGERSFDVSAIEHPDKDVQKVNLDQKQNEDEAIEKKTEEIQRDEQKHDDSSTELTTETLLEPQSSEIGTPNLQEDTDVFEAEQTETVATEVLMNEQTQHIPQESIPNIADVEAEKSTETEEMSEHENTPNNTETLYTDAEDEKENIAKPSTDEQDGTVNEEDESSDLGEKTAFTTPEGGSPTEEDVVQISGEDTVGISNNIEQIKEQSKDIIELDAIQSEDHTNDQDNEQPHDVELPMQVGERSFDVSAIEHPDEDVQKVNLDQQQNEDEAIEKKTEEIQRDEQKHDDSSTELTTETLLEPQSSEIGTPNLQEDTDVFEAEQTETVATEVLMNEQTQHIPQESIPNIADVEAEKSTETEEMSEHENALNNTETLYTDAEDEKENIAKPSTDELDGTIDETINEEVGNGLASPIKKDLQNTSDPAPSNEEILENTPTLVPQNVEPKVHGEEEECINNVNDDVQAIQASEEEIVDEVEKRQEMKNEDTDVNNDAIQTKPVDEEASVLHSSHSTDTKVDDTMSPYAEMVHGKIDAQPAETEEMEQDLSIHPKVVHDNLATAQQNGAEVETNSNEEMATSYKAVTEAVKFNEAIENKASGAEGALSDENLETFEDNRRNFEASSEVTASGESMNEDKEHDNLALPAHSAADGDTTEQGSGLEVTERGLLFPEKPLPTESEEQEESQTTKQQDEEDVHEQETDDTEKEEKEAEQSDLPVSNFLMNLIMGKESTEPERNSEFEAENKQEERTKDDSCLITSQQEESLVPIPAEHKVDKKLIYEQGKHNLEGSEETHDFKLESDEELSSNTHDLEAPVCQNNVQGGISSEQVPGGPGMMTEMETRDVKLGEKATNSVCQEHMEAGTKMEEGSLKSNFDESTNPKASQEDTLGEGRTNLQYESLTEDRSSDAVAGQTLLLTEPDMGAEKILSNDTDDLQSPLSTKGEESTESSIIEAESTIKEELVNEVEKEEDKEHTTNTGGATEGQIEKSHDNSQKVIEATSDEQTDKITEPAMGTEIKLVHEQDISAGSECQGEKQSYKLSNSELDNSEKALEIQSDGSSLHMNQDKQDEFAGEQIVMETNLLDKSGESSLHEEQETEIGQKSPKESDGGDQNCLATIEPLIKEENVNRTVESHVQTVNTKSNEEQEIFKSQVQERDLDVVSAKEVPKTEENVVQMAKPEFSTDEEQCPKKDESNTSVENVDKTEDEKEAKSFTGEAAAKIEEQGAVQKVSQRDLSVVLPTEAPGSEESFVDIKNEDFSTDEEQSPTKDESSMAEDKSYDEKTNGDEEAKNFTDEAPTKIEEREAGQKASPKKHNILFGVGSKVKHQLAKVKKAIIGKPGHTKSELAKS